MHALFRHSSASRIAATLLLVFACCLGVSAPSSGRFLVKEWTTDDGMPQNVVLAMAQTRDGYLWLGTGNGLARFDGVRFKTFEEAQAQGLNSSKILRLFEDHQRNLWVATDNLGIMAVDPHGRVTQVLTGNAAEDGPPLNICEDSAGNVWLHMSKGQLYCYVRGQTHPVLLDCRGVVADNSGRVWIARPKGSLLGGTVSESGTELSLTLEVEVGGDVDFLLSSKHGGYWCLANGQITKWNRETREKSFGEYPWSPGVPILTACEDLEGNLVVGTYGEGIYWFSESGAATRVQGVSHESIWSLVVDREGNLWVGTNGGGLNRVRRQKFDVLSATLGTTVQSVCPGSEHGVWIGYHGERVDHWDGTALQQFTNLWATSSAAPPGLDRLYVQTVFKDRDRQVWIGGSSTMSPRICLYVLAENRVLPVLGPSALNRDPSAIYQDPNGLLWIGTQGGLVCRDGESWRVYTTRDGLSSDSVRAIAADGQGNLWVGTERGGLNRFRDGTFTVFRKQAPDGLPSDDISSLHIDKDDVLWIGTSSGLVRYDHGRWARFTTRDGLASNRIGYLLEDDQGFLWIGSTAGLMRLPKRSLNDPNRDKGDSIPCRLFGKLDGLPTGECTAGSQPGACRTSDGKLWFPTINGLVVVQPAELKPNTNPPPVVIEAVRVDDELVGADTLRAPLPSSIALPAGKESIEIYFANLNLSAPDSGLFKYWLEGHERDWTEVEAETRYVRYSRLPPGQYQFHVKASNEDGLWNETPATLQLVVLPPFWRTWWFIAGATLLLLGLIIASVTYVSTQRLQRQLAALRQQEALERERARIARDLHDQLGANLTQVALLGEMAESDKNLPEEVESHARQISQTARETTHALDEIVWTVNPSNDTLDGLVNYLCKYAQDYLAMAGLKYRLEVPAELPTVSITPELRHNVFLAAKEAINNIVKHSKATAAWLRLGLESDRFVLEIEDDGRGLTPADEKKGRNGLRNMRKRLEEVGGKCDIAARPGGGTSVKLAAPLGKQHGALGTARPTRESATAMPVDTNTA